MLVSHSKIRMKERHKKCDSLNRVNLVYSLLSELNECHTREFFSIHILFKHGKTTIQRIKNR